MGPESQKLPASRLRASSDPGTTNREKFLHQLMRQHWRDNDESESLEAVREQHAHDMADLQYINQDLTWDIQENLAHEREQSERADFFQGMFESATQRLKIARTVRGQVLETLTSVRDTMDQLEMDILSMRQNMRASEGTIEALRRGRDAKALQPTPSLVRPSPHLRIPAEPWQSLSTEATSPGSAMELTGRTLDGELGNAWWLSRDSSAWSSSLMGSKPSPSVQLFDRRDRYPDEKVGKHEALNRSLRSSLHVSAHGSPPTEAVLDAMHPVVAPLSLARAPGTVKSLRDGDIPIAVTPPNSALLLDMPSPGLARPPAPPLYLGSPPRRQRNSPGKTVRVMSDSSGTPTESRQEHPWSRSEGSTSDTSDSRLAASSNTSLVSISLGAESSKGAAKPNDDDKSSNTSIRWSGTSMVSHGGPSEEKPQVGEERDHLAGPMSLSEHLALKIHQQSGSSAFWTSRADARSSEVVKNGSVKKIRGESAAAPPASASERLVECIARVVMAIDEAQSECQTRGLSPFDFDLRVGPDGYVLIESGKRSKPHQSNAETPRSQRPDKSLPSPFPPVATHHSTATTSNRSTTKNIARKGMRLWLVRVVASALQLAICLVVFTLINVLIAIKEEWRCGNVSHVKRDEIMSWRSDLLGWDVIDWIRYRVTIWLDANRELNV